MINGDLTRGERLKFERERLKIGTQEDLAKLLGKSKNSVIRYEKHNDALNADDFLCLHQHGFDVQYLIFGTRADMAAGLTDDEAVFVSVLRQVAADKRAALLDLVKTYAKHFG